MDSTKGLLRLILDIPKLQLTSINDKYGHDFIRKRTFLTESYRLFKDEIFLSVIIPDPVPLPPFEIIIQMETYIDLDNPEKAILDAVATRLKINDRDILKKTTIKIPRKRGTTSALKIWFGHLKKNDIQ